MNSPIVGGVQTGHQHINPANHASKGIAKSMEPNTDGMFAKINSQKKYSTSKMGSNMNKGKKG